MSTKTEKIIRRLKPVELHAGHPDVERLIQDFRKRFKLGPRVPIEERATRWWGFEYQGRIVAIAGDYPQGDVLEITDCYDDNTLEGLVAAKSFMYGYYGQMYAGQWSSIFYSVLYANKKMWEMVVRETGDCPVALVFVHKRHEEPKQVVNDGR